MSQSTFIQNSQLSLLDPIYSMSARDRKLLEKSWAAQFHNTILPVLVDAEAIFAPLYSDKNNTRPSTPTYLVLGYLVLKSLFMLTDEELEQEIKFNIQYQYALGTTSMAKQHINQRTLNRFRAALAEYMISTGTDLLGQFFDFLAQSLKGKFLGKDLKRRMDSIMIDNGCRHLSRLQLAHVVNRNMLDVLNENKIAIPKKLAHYIEDYDENQVTYHDHRPLQEKMETAFKDSVEIKNMVPESLSTEEDYVLLVRFIDEQIDLDQEGNFQSIRAGKELKSDTMTNPADPESTIRKKAGKTHYGYVGNFAESVDANTNRKTIDSASLEQNIYSDSKFCKEELERMRDQNDTSDLYVDGAYSGLENVNLAKKYGINLYGTDMVGKVTPDLMADFSADYEKSEVICPFGKKADRVSQKRDGETLSVTFKNDTCSGCPYMEICPLKKAKKGRAGHVSQKKIDRARMQRTMSTSEYKEKCRFRNGVEAIPSQLRRNQNIDHLPAKGLVRKKIWYLLSLLAINVRRALKYSAEDMDAAAKISGILVSIGNIVKYLLISQCFSIAQIKMAFNDSELLMPDGQF